MQPLIPAGQSALLRYSPVAANPNPSVLSPQSKIREIQKSKANTHSAAPCCTQLPKEILWYLLNISDRMSRASSCTDTSSCFPIAPVSWAVIFLHTFAVMVEPARERFFPSLKKRSQSYTENNNSPQEEMTRAAVSQLLFEVKDRHCQQQGASSCSTAC